MTFQFMCPQGHIVQAAEAHAGQQSTCPVCGTAMVIPNPDPNAQSAPAVAPVQSPSPLSTPNIPAPVIQTDDAGSQSTAPNQLPDLNTKPELFHIPCPNGHPLETPVDMLGQFAMCPHCQAQFELLEENSQEYKRRQQIAAAAREENLDRRWLNWAIAIVVLVLLGLVGLALASYLNR